MTAVGHQRIFRHRLIWSTVAVLVAVGSLLTLEREARAQQNIELTMMFHGSVGGKIAPCG